MRLLQSSLEMMKKVHLAIRQPEVVASEITGIHEELLLYWFSAYFLNPGCIRWTFRCFIRYLVRPNTKVWDCTCPKENKTIFRCEPELQGVVSKSCDQDFNTSKVESMIE